MDVEEADERMRQKGTVGVLTLSMLLMENVWEQQKQLCKSKNISRKK